MQYCKFCGGELYQLGVLSGRSWVQYRTCSAKFHSGIRHNEMDDWWQDDHGGWYDEDDRYYDES